VDKKTRDEVVVFRKKMVVMSQEKKAAFKSLSQEAQLYLEKEKEYKAKLPFNQRKEITILNKD
jgi:hypothetical protein